MLAILIGVRDYNWLPDVHWADKDVELVAETLQMWCHCNPDDIVLMTNRGPEALKPTRGNILGVLNHRLQRADQQGFERVLIYFAGHGLKDNQGNLYLAPQDHVAGLTQQTGVRVAEIREALNRCTNIGTKFVVLDACHSGETRDAAGSLGSEIGVELSVTQGLLTLASCQPNEQSIGWHEMRQGLFTYWFCRGLGGAADQAPYGNGDGIVDTGELAHYVRDNVVKTADKLGHQQQPKVIPSHGWQGPATLALLGGNADKRKQTLRGWQHVEQALKYRNGGNFAAAIDELENAFRLGAPQPEPRELFALRGRFHVERGKSRENPSEFEAALEDLNQAIRRHHPAAPPHELAAFYALRCEANYNLKRFHAALKDAGEVIRYQSTNAQAYRNRAKLYQLLGHEQLAQEDAERAESLSRENTPATTPSVALPPIPAIESTGPTLDPPANVPTVELRNHNP